jgi:hypothetical protein
MKFILTNWTEIDIAHQALPNVCSILLHLAKSFPLAIVEFIVILKVTILTMSITDR